MKSKITWAIGALFLSAGILISLWSDPKNSSSHQITPHPSPNKYMSEMNAAPDAAPFQQESLANADFKERAHRILMMPMEGAREETIRILAEEWTAADSEAAERWAMSLDVVEERKQALTHICIHSASADPRRAIQLAQVHELHESLIHAAANIWASKDAVAASEWASSLPDGQLRDQVHLQLLLIEADAAPSSAAARLQTLYPSGGMQEEATLAVLHRWLRQNADEAQRWVATFNEGILKERAMTEIRGMIAIHPSAADE